MITMIAVYSNPMVDVPCAHSHLRKPLRDEHVMKVIQRGITIGSFDERGIDTITRRARHQTSFEVFCHPGMNIFELALSSGI